MSLHQSPFVSVKRIAGKGRGVVAKIDIPAETEFERAPVLVLPDEAVDDNMLVHYVYHWGRGTVGLALGYGSLYNHSFRPNARYDDVGSQTKVFTALRDIAAGEEITINYNGEPDNKTPVHFDVREPD